MKHKLKELFDLQMGKTPSRNNAEYWNTTDYKWISIADLSKTEKYITETKEYISQNAIKESGIRIIPKNTVIMSFKLSIGKTAITTENMYSNEAIMAFIDKHVIEILPEYIYYMFRYRNWEDGSNKAVMGKTLNKATLADIEIEIGSIEEQKEAVHVLDKVMNILSDRKKESLLLDELVKARFVELFGDEKEFLAKAQNRVSDICRTRVGIVIQPTQYYTDEPNGVRAFRSLNIKPFYINDSDWVYFSESDNDQLCRTQVKAGDVAVVRTGANLGDCCVIQKEYNGCNAIDILLLTCNENILPMYLSAFINYPVGKQQIINVQRGGAIKHLNLKQLENSRIYVPKMELQQQFVNFVTQVNKSKLLWPKVSTIYRLNTS